MVKHAYYVGHRATHCELNGFLWLLWRNTTCNRQNDKHLSTLFTKAKPSILGVITCGQSGWLECFETMDVCMTFMGRPPLISLYLQRVSCLLKHTPLALLTAVYVHWKKSITMVNRKPTDGYSLFIASSMREYVCSVRTFGAVCSSDISDTITNVSSLIFLLNHFFSSCWCYQMENEPILQQRYEWLLSIIAVTFETIIYTVLSTCLFHVRSLEMVTTRRLAYCTLSFPSIIHLGTVFLKSGSCIKLISLSFDLSELISCRYVMSTLLRCQRRAVGPIHSFFGICQTAGCRLHIIYTTGQAFLDHLCKLENI